MRSTFWDKRIPTLLSILLIGTSIVMTSILVRSSTVFVSRADVTQTPQNVKITNILDTSFTVSYTTEVENIGSVNFGKDKNLGQTALDDRDQKEGIRPHKIHNFTLHYLKPDTHYFFTITSGQNTFLNNNIPYETTTASIPKITQAPQTPITGKIVLPNGESPKEALVYAKIDKAQEISSLSKTDGTYLLALNSLLPQDLSSPVTLDKNNVIKMIITNGVLKSSVLFLGIQINPVPVITLSQDYDFTQRIEPTATKSSELSGFSSIASKLASSSAQNPSIIVPKKDQSFTDQQPVFSGVSTPYEKVQVIIRSQVAIQGEVTADSFGNWFFRPTQALSPGKHTISIQTKNKSGILQNITQSFVVFASEIPTPSPTPTALPSLIPTPTSTPTPTAIVPTATPIPSPLPISEATPTIAPETPLGNSSILIAGIFGLSIVALGCLLFIKTRGGTSFP